MSDRRLDNTFEQDTKKFIGQINSGLIKLENEGYSADEINHVFRCIHSIKSEAAYLGYDEIASAAHDMESAIEPLRNVGTEVEVDPALIEYCFRTVDRIEVMSREIPAEANENAVEELPADAAKPYSDFELMLLSEARARGEGLFLLSFSVSDEESMKYPRAYLALSNLEQSFNVIKVEPVPEMIDSTIDGRLTVTLTSAATESRIVGRINIDHIMNIEIKPLSYANELKNIPAEYGADGLKLTETSDERVISVEAEEIDAISKYVGEIKKRLSDLTSAYETEDATNSLGYDIAGIETISNSIEKMMTNLKTVDFNTHFAGYRRVVRDIAAKLGKKAELVFDPENIRIQRDFADFIAEPVLQLIRNAVVHGIEMPKIRSGLGKNETGSIKIKISGIAPQIQLSVADDGAGIDEGRVIADSDGAADEHSLIETISRPGFTTLEHSVHFAGRGVGLDLVVTRIARRGGVLELENKPGKGCEFRVVFSGREEISSFLVVEYKKTVFAVPLEDNQDVVEISSGGVRQDENGIYFRELPLFSYEGRLRALPETEDGVFQALKISSGGKTGFILFDESLFEVSYEGKRVERGLENESPLSENYLGKLLINGIEADFPVISEEVVID